MMMKRPVLTEFLLKLATDPGELEAFRKSKADAESAMKAAGLTVAQRRAVLKGAKREILAAVNAELKKLRPKGLSRFRPPVITLEVGILLVTPPVR
jgi:hypothetical protein